MVSDPVHDTYLKTGNSVTSVKTNYKSELTIMQTNSGDQTETTMVDNVCFKFERSETVIMVKVKQLTKSPSKCECQNNTEWGT